MMHYRKGDNIEQKLTKDELPFEDFLPKGADFLWMHVNGGTKITNVMTFAKNALDKGEHKSIVWSGNGGGVIKTISCAEIIKRSYPLYQVTRMRYVTIEEQWKPQTDGLGEIIAKRLLPSLHIYMSLEPIDDSVSGLQKPNCKTDFWVYNSSTSHNTNAPSGSGGASSNNSYNRNQRPRNDNMAQRRPLQKYQRPQNTASLGGDHSSQPYPSNAGPADSNQQNKMKRRKPRPNQKREANRTEANDQKDGGGDANQSSIVS